MSTLLRLIGGFAALAIAAAVADSSFAQTARPTVAAAQTDGQPAAGSPTPAPALRAPGTDGTVVAVQPFQRTTTATVADQGQLWLVDLNPNVHSWLLLVRTRPGRSEPNFVHIENPLGRRQQVTLEAQGLVVTEGETRVVCGFQTGDSRDLFGTMGQPLTPFCENRLLVRAQQGGYRTTEEAAVSLLRSMGGIGESIINIYKTTIGQDANLERVGTQTGNAEAPPAEAAAPTLPRAATVSPGEANRVFSNHRLGLSVARPASRTAMRPGQWYPAAAQPGIAVSIIVPLLVLDSIPKQVKAREAHMRNVCTNNMQIIQIAKQKWALENNKQESEIPTKADLLPHLPDQQFPRCPGRGDYTINAVNNPPACPIPSHKLHPPEAR